jgi:CDP-diacylglycerol---glycerol-3-phosphate 3-phosphatidyltransferase
MRPSVSSISGRDAVDDTREGAEKLDYRLEWPHLDVTPHHIESKARRVLSTLQASYISAQSPTSGDEDVLVFPVIQAGQFGIREEESALTRLFHYINAYARRLSSTEKHETGLPIIHLTSGYFNLHAPYQSLLLESESPCTIIAAAPKVYPSLFKKTLVNRCTSPKGQWFLRFCRRVRPHTRRLQPS